MFNFSSKPITEQVSDASIIIYKSIKDLKESLAKHKLAEHCDYLKASAQLKDDDFSLCSLTNTIDASGPKEYIFVHPSNKNYDALRAAAGTVARTCQSLTCKSIALQFMGYDNEDALYREFIEGFILGFYQRKAYKSTEKKVISLPKITFLTKASSSLKRCIQDAICNAKAQNFARDLANMPANDLYPETFVKKIKSTFKEAANLSISVIDKKEAQKMGMGSFLAVAQGSEKAPFMLCLSLNESKKEKPIILVGKGVTFDSGGISIKPSTGMSLMKGDMGGAAAVAGAMHGLIAKQCKKHVIAIIPLVENMPSGSAYRPGDVITAMNGKTIEVINTDAEGRLILADALCLAATKKPTLIIDVATLTGAACVALGEMASAIMGNSESHIQAMIKDQDSTGERLWQLPLYDEYLDYLKSDTADIINCAENRQAGTSTAGKFLEQFVDKQPWIHLDIAPTMHAKSSSGYHVKGMLGVAARTLINTVENI